MARGRPHYRILRQELYTVSNNAGVIRGSLPVYPEGKMTCQGVLGFANGKKHHTSNQTLKVNLQTVESIRRLPSHLVNSSVSSSRGKNTPTRTHKTPLTQQFYPFKTQPQTFSAQSNSCPNKITLNSPNQQIKRNLFNQFLRTFTFHKKKKQISALLIQSKFKFPCLLVIICSFPYPFYVLLSSFFYLLFAFFANLLLFPPCTLYNFIKNPISSI